jgi:hypothetical protein
MSWNETFSASKTLIDANEAYIDHGSSCKAVVTSLLTSDSFLFRK